MAIIIMLTVCSIADDVADLKVQIAEIHKAVVTKEYVILPFDVNYPEIYGSGYWEVVKK